MVNKGIWFHLCVVCISGQTKVIVWWQSRWDPAVDVYY